jgi:hypothetical protein
LHEWALDSDQDLDDLGLVKMVNPAPWQTVDALQERRDSPSMTPAQWARFACGVWLRGDDSAINAQDWARALTDDRPQPGEPIFGVGIDLGWTWDTTAIVPLWTPTRDRRILLDPTVIVPPRDGRSTPPSKVREALSLAHSEHPFGRVAMDRAAGGEQLAEWIETDLGCEVVLYTNGTAEQARCAHRLSMNRPSYPRPM